MINQAQKIQLDRVRQSGEWNDFDGLKIAKSLEDNRDLWTSFVFGRFYYNQLIELRDLEHDVISADEMYLLADKKDIQKILNMIQGWDASEIGYLEGTLDYKNEPKWQGVPSSHGSYNNFCQSFGTGLESNQVVFRIWWD